MNECICRAFTRGSLYRENVYFLSDHSLTLFSYLLTKYNSPHVRSPLVHTPNSQKSYFPKDGSLA